jgi:hypothetical protein
MPMAGDARFISKLVQTDTVAFVSTYLNVYGIDRESYAVGDRAGQTAI